MVTKPTVTQSSFRRGWFDRQPASVQELDAWEGYACENSNRDLTGSKVKLRICSADGAPRHEVTASHVSAANWLLDNQHRLRDVLNDALYKLYPEILAAWREWGDLFDDDPSNPLLRVSGPEDFRHLVDLSYVDIFPHRKDGLPYLGFEFECAWDAEHGCQALMHGFRVVGLWGDVNNEFTIKRDGGAAA